MIRSYVKLAFRYFGKVNPVGQRLTFIFNNKQKESFIVQGVTDELPQTASFAFNFLVNYNKSGEKYGKAVFE